MFMSQYAVSQRQGRRAPHNHYGCLIPGDHLGQSLRSLCHLKRPALMHEQRRRNSAVQKLTELAIENVRDFQGQGLGIIVWAYAKINYDASKIRQLLEDFAQEAVRRLSSEAADQDASLKLGAQSLSNMVYAYAVLGYHPGSHLMSAIAKGVQWQLRDFSPQGLSNIVWAYAKLGAAVSLEVQTLLEALAVEAASQLMDIRSRQRFIPQNLSNMVYGYAVLGYNPGPMLLGAVAKEAQRQLHDFGPQELTNMVWAFAKLGGPLGPDVVALLDLVPSEVVRQLTDGMRSMKVKPQTMSNLLWAYATLKRVPDKLLDALTKEVLRQLVAFKPQELSNTVWAYAVLDYYPGEHLMTQLASAIHKQIDAFKAPELSSTLWAFAALRHHPGAHLMDAALGEVQRQADKLKPQELAQVVWAAAELGHKAGPALTEGVIAGMGRWAQGYRAQDICNVVWALAVLDVLSLECASMLFAKCAAMSLTDFSQESLCQLYQAQLTFGWDSNMTAASLPPELLQRAGAALHQAQEHSSASSDAQEVSAVLNSLAVTHATNHMAEGGGPLCVDVALTQQQTALVLDQTIHFSVNQPFRPLGRTLLRWRMLAKRGWKVLSVPFYIWRTLQSAELRACYLQQLLQASFAPTEAGPLASAADPAGMQACTSQLQATSLSEGMPGSCSAQQPASCLPTPGAGQPWHGAEAAVSYWGDVRLENGALGAQWENGRAGVSLAGGLGAATGLGSNSQDLRQLWHQVMQVGSGMHPPEPEAGVSIPELKRVIEGLSLEKSAVVAVAPCLAQISPQEFSSLLLELAHANHAFRAWQLFDWVRGLPKEHGLHALCDATAYTTMITLCGPWQQLRRALQLVADMRARSIECGLQAYTALLNAAIKCSDAELVVDVYRQTQAEELPLDQGLYHMMVDLFVKMGSWQDALAVLEDMRARGVEAEAQTYNLLIVTCTKMGQPRQAIAVYEGMIGDGVQPNSKTFTALIGAFAKCRTLDRVLDIVEGLAAKDGPGSVASTYASLMAACEKAGQWDMAMALFKRITVQNFQPDVSIFNSLIAACAHAGQYANARTMFNRMAEFSCLPDAVTYANLIRAYKKGGQWCNALDTFEAMQAAGCRPHAAVVSSVIDVLWQTGIAWAQAKALHVFQAAVQSGILPPAYEAAKKGTVKVDLQALTVGVALLSMNQWLLGLREQAVHEADGTLEVNRKVALVNGMGEHARSQGNSSAVKEAVGACLVGAKAPFRLVQDHSRSGRLEASTLALRKWLFSDMFTRYHALFAGQGPLDNNGMAGPLASTGDYLRLEADVSSKCADMFAVVRKHEQMHPVTLQGLHANPGGYLGQRKQLVMMALHFCSSLRLADIVAHAVVVLMDRIMMTGVHMTDKFETLFVCACLRIAAAHEGAYVPSKAAVAALVAYPESALERMENNILLVLQHDTSCVSALHCLQIYAQRLGCNLASLESTKRTLGCAVALLNEALGDLGSLQYQASLSAAGALCAARKIQGLVPAWPSVLAGLTGLTEAGGTPFAAAAAHSERICMRLYGPPVPLYAIHGR
ncbi:hypothetical protein WJX72_010082 [[Myrmecia] bisecta]|uniref:RAP domain-containing protein n=1 Tax=[Myrmecia] bisecta TaxID=41462 RepID=A0AAW1PUI4_9CHLO